MASKISLGNPNSWGTIASSTSSPTYITQHKPISQWKRHLDTIPLPSNIEEIVYPLLGMCDKLVLGGSLGLYVMDIMDYDFNKRKPDIDFSLTEPLTAEELNTIKDFFQLEFVLGSNDYDVEITPASPTEDKIITKSTEHFLTKELIQLRKFDENRNVLYTLDFFNSQYIKPKDVVEVRIPFKDTPYTYFPLRVNHPAITISYKARYAYDTRVGKQFKHWEDIEKIDKKKYFQIIKKIKTKQVKSTTTDTSSKDSYKTKSYFDPYDNMETASSSSMSWGNLPF
jgi:hypothetical protein